MEFLLQLSNLDVCPMRSITWASLQMHSCSGLVPEASACQAFSHLFMLLSPRERVPSDWLPRRRVPSDWLPVQANSAAASSGRSRWPRNLLVFICFLSAEMKELHPFSLDQQVWAHFGLFLTGEGWRLSTWNLKYKPQASRNAGIYCPALLYKMSCVPAPPEFSVFQSLTCCSPWTWVVCTLWLRESYCSQTPSARCFFFSLLL